MNGIYILNIYKKKKTAPFAYLFYPLLWFLISQPYIFRGNQRQDTEFLTLSFGPTGLVSPLSQLFSLLFRCTFTTYFQRHPIRNFPCGFILQIRQALHKKNIEGLNRQHAFKRMFEADVEQCLFSKWN